MHNRLARDLLIWVFLFEAAPAPAAGPPPLRELRIQQAQNCTYFHARFEQPRDHQVLEIKPGPYALGQRWQLARLPQLVPQDAETAAVYLRVELPHYRPVVGFAATRPQVPIDGLEFVGKTNGADRARFLLIYPTGDEEARPAAAEPGKERPEWAKLVRRATWKEVEVELDFSKAVKRPVPSAQREERELERLWAEAQAARFAVLEALAPDAGFYGFACAATGRKYGVPDPALEGERQRDRERLDRQLYETTTGAAAIAESLQLERMLNPERMDRGPRTVDIMKVPGIDIAEHPWQKMMAGKRPAPEPLARLTPGDNYYIHFKNVKKFIEFGELLDQWGTNFARAYEMTSRDYRLKERYERQLCIKSTWLGQQLGPHLIRSLAVTGSDFYLREGSDVTVLFHAVNPRLLLAALEPFIAEARKEFGGELNTTKSEYKGVWIESCVTPLREVSLHRAILDEFVVYSNSPAAIRRVIDVQQGRAKALADSLDFQYMRTVFRLDDQEEDGFAFLPDAFIRNLVGPAAKIKEKRRLEALTSLYMTTHAAMFHAWETGKRPADHQALLAAAKLRQEELYVPEGKGVAWDPQREVAVSDVYNTIHFATPLIELPIDKVTAAEEAAYGRFRQGYLQLWRRYFDPVGMRFSLRGDQVVAETYILPLLNNSEYNTLRWFSGGGTAAMDLSRLSPRTLLQFTAHVSPNLRSNDSGVGEWAMLGFDDSRQYAKLAELLVRREVSESPPADEEVRAVLRLPVTAGIKIADARAFEKSLQETRKLAGHYLGPVEDMTPRYRGVGIAKTAIKADNILGLRSSDGELPTLYSATIDDAWYVSLSEDAIRDWIDQAVARKDGKGPPKRETQINSSLYLAPEAAYHMGPALRSYLEWETFKRALSNTASWYALYHSGLTKFQVDSHIVALKYYGYVPVSPDETPYEYKAKFDEVASSRHGSLQRPTLESAIKDQSPLADLLAQVRTVRVDLRFREDGVHTVLTINRRKP